MRERFGSKFDSVSDFEVLQAYWERVTDAADVSVEFGALEVALLAHRLSFVANMTYAEEDGDSTIWITPKGAQGNRTAGIGVQFSDQDQGNTQKKIENYLAGLLGGDTPTHTM